MVVLAAVVPLCVAGCTPAARPQPGGPLNAGSGRSTNCFPSTGATRYTYAENVLRNTGAESVKIRNLSLVEPSGFRIGKSFVTPVPDGPATIIGSTAGFPPGEGREAELEWARRTRAVGAHIPGRGATRNLLVELRMPADSQAGSVAAIEVEYTAGGQLYSVRTTGALVVRRRC